MRHAMIIALALAALSAPSHAARADLATSELPVISGDAAGLAEVYGTVALIDPETYESFCTGTLIAPTVVLTAAHCLVEQDEQTDAITGHLEPSKVLVAAGVLDVRDVTDEQVHVVVTVVAHPSYPNASEESTHPSGAAKSDDIGLLILDEPITGLDVVPIPTVESAASALTDGVRVTITGYGKTSETDEVAGVLYIADTPFVYRSVGEFVLGGVGEPDTCQGDSGGPAYLSIGGVRSVIGASSRGAEDVEVTCGEGGVYTFVPVYREWLASASDGAYSPAGSDPQDPGAAGTSPEDTDSEDAGTEDTGCRATPGGATPALALLMAGVCFAARRRQRTRQGLRRSS